MIKCEEEDNKNTTEKSTTESNIIKLQPDNGNTKLQMSVTGRVVDTGKLLIDTMYYWVYVNKQ